MPNISVYYVPYPPFQSHVPLTDTVRARLFNHAFKSKLFLWPLTFSSNLLADDVTSDSEPNDLELCARVLSHLLL